MLEKTDEKLAELAEGFGRERDGTLRNVLATTKMFVGFPGVAVHMMVTFYLTLLIVAIMAGPNGESPPLMGFILIWHLLAIPTWFLKSFCVQILQRPFGMLLFFVAIATLGYVFSPQLEVGLGNIGEWIAEAKRSSLL